MNASRTPVRAATTAAGSSGATPSGLSGIGSSHGTSAVSPGSPEGSMRRLPCRSAFRQALVAIRYSQVRSDARPSKSA